MIMGRRRSVVVVVVVVVVDGESRFNDVASAQSTNETRQQDSLISTLRSESGRSTIFPRTIGDLLSAPR